MHKFDSSHEWAKKNNEMEFSIDHLRKKAAAVGIVDVRVTTKDEDPLYPRIRMTRKNGNIIVRGIPAGDSESLRIYLAGWIAGFDEGITIN